MASAPGYALPAGLSLPGPDSAASTLTCRLVPRGAQRYTLHLSGSLHHAWAGRLAAGLGARHVSVVRATARRGSTRWTAEIDVDVPAGVPAPSAVDFVALMKEHRDPSSAEPIALAGWRVQATRTDVEVEIRGEDAVGLLGRILLVFAELGLFPRAMRVDTFGSAVRDVFLLQTLAGEAPSGATIAALRARLDGLLADD